MYKSCLSLKTIFILNVLLLSILWTMPQTILAQNMTPEVPVVTEPAPAATPEATPEATVPASEATPEATAFVRPTLSKCPLSDGVFNITWIPKALDNPVFELARVGAERSAADLTAAGPCEVKVLPVAPLRTTAEDQAQLIRDVIKQGGTDAIGISCIDPQVCIDPINEAIAAGIPVMTWDSDSPDSDRFTYLGIDNYEGGKAAADLMVRTMGETGQVAMISGVQGSFNLEERMRGFRDGIAAYPGIKIVATVYCDDLATKAVTEVEQVMTDHPGLTGWFFVGLWPFLAGSGAMPQWEQATQNKQLTNVAVDTLPVELSLMQDGFISGLVGQKYWGWGYDTVQMLYDHVLFGRTFDRFTNSGMDIVTPLNVDAMQHAWDTNDFSQPLPPPFAGDASNGSN